MALDSETIGAVDAIASALINDYWTPSGKKGHALLERVDANAYDLNLLDPYSLRPEQPRLAGRENAYEVVLSDVAMRVSADLVEANRLGQFGDLGQKTIDPSIAFDPVRFDLSEEEKASKAREAARYAQSALYLRGAPPPSLFDRGPITPETASKLAKIGERLVSQQQFRRNSTPETSRAHSETVLYSDRIRRIERQRDLSTDPAARPAYDLVAADLGIRLADTLRQADERHLIKRDALTLDERRMLVDPHGIGARGLAAQAQEVGAAGARVTAKGPVLEETPGIPAMKVGAER